MKQQLKQVGKKTIDSSESVDEKYKNAFMVVKHRVFVCWKCGHSWHQRMFKGNVTYPKTCPSDGCRSAFWYIKPESKQEQRTILAKVNMQQ